MKKIKSKLSKRSCPVVKTHQRQIKGGFPVDHYSYSSMVQFASNPVLFRIKYINKDKYDTTTSISGVIGNAFHTAMEIFDGGGNVSGDQKPKNEQDAVRLGLEAGIDFIEQYNEGFISFSKTVPTKQKALELFAFAYNSYIKEKNNTGEEILAVEDEICENIDIEWRGRQLKLPVKLKGYLDKVVRVDGKLKIKDYKTCRAFSDPEKIDGSKIIQAVSYYLLAYAKYGVEPYSIIYEEIKTSKDESGKQLRRYEIVFAENELYFDFFFRLYEDITAALLGKMVYVPNVHTLFDNEIAIISYIHRFDESEERAKQMKKLKVDNITDLLKKKIQSAGNMRKFMQAVEQQFTAAKNINYNSMEIHEKIATKLMEYGMILQFDSKIDGLAVDLYRYTPSIGLKMSRIRGFVSDIEQVIGKSGIRVLAPIPNTTLVGFEIPKDERKFIDLPKCEVNDFNLAIGQTIMGEEKRFDIRTAPHMLVAGSSGSGKSVFLHSIIRQLLTVPKTELHIFDPKQIELAQYEDTAKEYRHNPASIASAIEALVEEMENRYSQMKKLGVRDIEKTKMPYKFVIIDEYADLVLKSQTGNNIQLLAQKGRACGIHLIIATQRASTKIISGDIKINFPVKVVFRMSKEVDSRVMLDEIGAEKLLGKGDCLFSSESGIERLQAYSVKV